MSDFQHLVLTRFNLHFPQWGRFRGLDDSWLDRRLAIFSRICLPSMRAQVSQDFEWLVFFHPETPDRHRATIESMADVYPCLRPVFVTGIEQARTAIRAAMRGRHVITTRLDNDDALWCGHIRAVQGRFARQRMQFINFPIGYYVARRGQDVRRHRYPSNMFMSLIIDTRHMRKSILDYDHSRVHRDHEIVDVETATPAWMVTIHGQNMASRMRGVMVDPGKLREHFPDVGIDAQI